MLNKKRSAVLFVAVAVLMLTGALFASKVDNRIEESAKKSYVFCTFLKGDDIQIKSTDGVVTLTGTVSNESHLMLAEDTVADLPGVKKVENLLVLRADILADKEDARIHRRIVAMLLLHNNLDSDNTNAAVENGQVTLTGELGSQAEKGLTEEYVKDVDGVTGVTNHLTVKEGHKKKHRSFGTFIDDTSIKAQIKSALLFHRGTNVFKTHISVRNGVVTVTGTANNQAGIELVSKRIEDIHGVVKIHNRMLLK